MTSEELRRAICAGIDKCTLIAPLKMSLNEFLFAVNEHSGISEYSLTLYAKAKDKSTSVICGWRHGFWPTRYLAMRVEKWRVHEPEEGDTEPWIEVWGREL